MNSFPRPHPERGVALVIVLSILVVVTILLVTLITVNQTDRAASRNYAQSAKAEELGRGALDLIVGDLQREILAGSNAVDRVPAGAAGKIYVPKTAASIVPARYGNGSGATVEPNLIRRSLADAGAVNAAYPGTDYESADLPPVRASAVPTSTPSANRRSVSAERWNKPRLLRFPGSFTAPDWIYVTRSGADALSGFSAPLADRDSPQYVLGRFAYTIYDEGGLLDINLAGAPTGAGAPSAEERGGKAFVGFADLTGIPGLDNPSQAESLVNWRNAWSKADYPELFVANGAEAGFLEVMGDASGSDHTFLGRQDLIDYAGREGFTDALPYLGTFSREQNSASIKAGTNPVLNPEFSRLTFDGKSIPRFPIGKFELLEQDPSALSGDDEAEIEELFGLTPATDADGDFRAWVYQSATIGSPEAAIAAGRVPNLFELMKAAVHNPSLGVAANNDGAIKESGGGGTYSPETNPHHQIARIIANLADQSDADNFPTTIRIGSNEVYGIESLPYFSEIFFKARFRRPNGEQPFDSANGTLYCYFELWNPHQGPIPSDGPSQVRIRSNSGARVMMSYAQIPDIGYATTVSGGNPNAPNLPFPTTPITLPNLASYQGNPRLADNSIEPETRLTELIPPVSGWSALTVNVAKPANFTSGSVFTALHLRSFVPILEFQGAAGNWHPYTTFAGHATDAGTTGIQGGDQPFMGNENGYGPSNNNDAANANRSLPKTDPRTFRFRSGFDFQGTANQTTGPTNQRLWQNRSTKAPEYPSVLAANQGTNAVPDLDGVKRPGDAYLGAAADPLFNQSARPIILNRPFRSIGEIGYVFRDVPWKTLDLFSGDSADAGLLDIFSLEESDVVAGRVSINTRNPEVLQALLSGAIRNEVSGGDAISPADAETLAEQIVTATQSTKLLNRSDVLSALSPGVVSAALPAIKTRREAAVRALAPNTQTRTWNLLIDVVAEVGRFAPGAADLAAFNVEGSRRFWLHVAIDRFTGEVVDSSLETVYE